jgi:hypothetical protein
MGGGLLSGIAEEDEVHQIDTILDRESSHAGRTKRCVPNGSRSIRSTASAIRSANTILPANISNPPHRWAAVW